MIPYRGNLPWLVDRTILFGRHGSHAYGLNIASSDEDFKGVAIAPREYYYGFLNRFEQAESKEPDMVIYDLRKFMLLAADCNPNIIEVLWSEHEVCTPAGKELLSHRDKFLSKKIRHTFSGYAVAQLKRINTHYRWLKNPPTKQPTRADFGLPEHTVIPKDQLVAAESAIRKQLDSWNWHHLENVAPSTRQALQDEFTRRLLEITQWSWDGIEEQTTRAAALTVGIDMNFIELLDKERRYTSRLREWQQYINWKNTRNPQRAELEAKHFYDTKHAMHLVRLLRMCREILTKGQVVVKRPDREELLAIRGGAWTYEQVVEYAAKEDLALEELVKTSTLPNRADRVFLDQLCVQLAGQSL